MNLFTGSSRRGLAGAGKNLKRGQHFCMVGIGPFQMAEYCIKVLIVENNVALPPDLWSPSGRNKCELAES